MPIAINEQIKKLKHDFYVEASTKYFDKYGYENAKMSELAAILEVSVGTIYKMFDSKENLYFEYIIAKKNHLLTQLNENAGGDPLENLKLYLRYKYEPFVANRDSIEHTITSDPFFFHKLNSDSSQVMSCIYDFIAKQLSNILDQPLEECMRSAILFKKLSDGYTESYIIKKFDIINAIDETISLFLDGRRTLKISKK
ncbi:MAG: TetR family transcriptional regulator [Helicobacteraceae bacterium]|nr:TetR family transcriptional regulator [Helicobacteraceae bacterium]